MGLEEPEIDLQDLIDNQEDDEDTGKDISDMSRKEVALKVLKEGQVNLGENRALIKCPCSKSNSFTGNSYQYICALSMRPDPEDGEQKPVCGGPIQGIKEYGSSEKWIGGSGVKKGCPYDPARFRNRKRDNDV